MILREFDMAKAGKKSKTSLWTDGLDKTGVREALEDATVDAYDEYEKHTGLLTAIQDELKFPFQVQVIGETVTVVDMEWPKNDEFGLDLIVERNGQRHHIEARSVNLLPPLPNGYLYLAAYLDWRRGL
jgi:hypothetical protein